MSTPFPWVQQPMAGVNPTPTNPLATDPLSNIILNGNDPSNIAFMPNNSSGDGTASNLFGDYNPTPYVYAPFAYTNGPSAGSLNLSIPTSILAGQGGSLDMNFNLGSNTDAIAANAYGFLANQNQNDQAFLGNTITNTQEWLGAAVSPILNAVAGESDSYYSSILGAFGQTESAQSGITALGANTITGISNNAIAASQTNANTAAAASEYASDNATTSAVAASNASIQSSQSSGGGCFITTAVCERAGLPDDCELLTTLRAWRDEVLLVDPKARELVHVYYRVAPLCVERINALQKETKEFVYSVLETLVRKAMLAIKAGEKDRALLLYAVGVEFACVAAGVYRE